MCHLSWQVFLVGCSKYHDLERNIGPMLTVYQGLSKM